MHANHRHLDPETVDCFHNEQLHNESHSLRTDTKPARQIEKVSGFLDVSGDFRTSNFSRSPSEMGRIFTPKETEAEAQGTSL